MNPLCMKCLAKLPHFFHGNGKVVQGVLMANPRCVKCLNGTPHRVCDKDAFNTDDAYKTT